MTFKECVMECAKNGELAGEFNRLTGNALFIARTSFEAAIDEACGYNPDGQAMAEFVAFVDEFVWRPLLSQQEGV